MSDLNVTTIQNNNIAKTDKLLAFNNNDSKAASIQDVVQLVPGKMAVATCTTAGNVATKAVTCDDWTNKPGLSILVEFSNANSADNVTLSINSGTAIPVYYMNTATEQVSGGAIPAGAVVFTLNAAGNKFYAHVTKLIEGAGVKIDGSKIEAVNDLPTDAVLHYSFDDLPDYPDGTADVRLTDGNTYDLQSTSYSAENGGGTTFSNLNGNVQAVISSGQGWNGLVIQYTTSKIIKIKIKVSSLVGSLRVLNGLSTNGIQMGTITSNGEYTYTALFNQDASTKRFAVLVVNASSSATVEILGIYIGDGSYSTPVIDNVNGQWNSVSQSGVAVQGVSGKGVKCFANKSVTVSSSFNLNDNFTISLWLNPENNTNDVQGTIFSNSQIIIRNGTTWGNYLMIYLYGQNEVLINGAYLGPLFTPNEWTHIVIIKNGTSVKYCKNGTLTNTYSLSNSELVRNTSTLTINGSTRPHSYDDLLIFDRALTEKEVIALYNNKANTPKYYSKADYLLEQIANNS